MKTTIKIKEKLKDTECLLDYHQVCENIKKIALQGMEAIVSGGNIYVKQDIDVEKMAFIDGYIYSIKDIFADKQTPVIDMDKKLMREIHQIKEKGKNKGKSKKEIKIKISLFLGHALREKSITLKEFRGIRENLDKIIG